MSGETQMETGRKCRYFGGTVSGDKGKLSKL